MSVDCSLSLIIGVQSQYDALISADFFNKCFQLIKMLCAELRKRYLEHTFESFSFDLQGSKEIYLKSISQTVGKLR